MALHASVTLPPENPAVREDTPWPELPILRVPENSASEDAGFLARHLNRNDDAERTYPFLGELSEEHTRPLALGRLRAGYGRVFRDNSVLFCGRNGTAWEEPSCFYVKASFRF